MHTGAAEAAAPPPEACAGAGEAAAPPPEARAGAGEAAPQTRDDVLFPAWAHEPFPSKMLVTLLFMQHTWM